MEEIPEQDIQHETVSSTKIRKALLEGNIQKANAYLDHHYIIIGETSKSNPALEEIGFPTYCVRIEEDSKLIPPNGVYAVTVVDDGTSYQGHVFHQEKRGITARLALLSFTCSIPMDDPEGKTSTLYFP